MRMQSKLNSFLEAITNTGIGAVLNVALTIVIFNWVYDYNVTFGNNIVATIIFTFVSVGRSYFVRRMFNKS